MGYKVLVLGASYGSLLGTKLLMAGHDVTLVCRASTAALINEQGTEVRIKLRDEDAHRPIRSEDQPGTLDAVEPKAVDVGSYNMVALAMAEPQYGAQDIRDLLSRIAAAKIPCLSIMNMPPLPYLKRIPGLDTKLLEPAYSCPEVWAGFDPDLVTLCSPDPQAYRVADEGANVLHVGLPTNFKAARFAHAEHNAMLDRMEADISEVRIEGKEVPVKLKAFDSLFVPLAKWSMLLTGNYRCILPMDVQPIRDAVHGNLDVSAEIYGHVDNVARSLGADAGDQVPFAKYARAAENLLKPSSVARSVNGGAEFVERVDMVVKLICDQRGMSHPAIDAVVATVETRIAQNRRVAA